MKFNRLLIVCILLHLKVGATLTQNPASDSQIVNAKVINTTKAINVGNDTCIKLDAPILAVIDGVRGLMDGEKIHKMLFLGRELNQFMYGTLDANNNRIPQYKFKDKFYTLKQLVEIEEEQLSKTNQYQKDKNPDQYQKEKEQFKKDRAELDELLNKLKTDFLGFTSKVSGDAKGSAQQTYMLIDNFISKYGDCSLKYWRIDKDEVASVHKRVTSIKLCFNMSYDLYNFLKAMICACPKAFQMYKDSQKSANRGNIVN